MNPFSRTLLTAGAVILGLTVPVAHARTSHVSYPNPTPSGVPLGTVEFRNAGNTTADICIDNGYLGRIEPGDRVVVHDVWAGETSARWEYTYNCDGETHRFYLDDCDRYVYTFRPHEPCDTYPTYPSYPTYPTYQTFGGSSCGMPVHAYPASGSYPGFSFSISDDDFHFGISSTGAAFGIR